jgi:hypothetical protein
MADIQIKPSIGETTSTEKIQNNNQNLIKLKETLFAGMTKLNNKIEELKKDLTQENDLNLLLNSFHSPQIDKLTEAMCMVQGEIECVGKGKQGHRNKYADLPAVIMAIKNLCAKNKIGIYQDLIVNPRNNHTYVLTIISHAGQWIKSLWPIKEGENDQEEGGAVTFWKRYILQSMFNVPVADEKDLDDYNNEEEPEPAKKEEPKKTNQFQYILNKKGNPGNY